MPLLYMHALQVKWICTYRVHASQNLRGLLLDRCLTGLEMDHLYRMVQYRGSKAPCIGSWSPPSDQKIKVQINLYNVFTTMSFDTVKSLQPIFYCFYSIVTLSLSSKARSLMDYRSYSDHLYCSRGSGSHWLLGAVATWQWVANPKINFSHAKMVVKIKRICIGLYFLISEKGKNLSFSAG